MSDITASPLSRFRQDMAADKKKAAILGLLFLALLIAVGRLFVSGSEPAAATASEAPVVRVAPKDPKVPKIRPAPQAKRRRSGIPDQEKSLKQQAAAKPSRARPVKGTSRTVSVDNMPRTLDRDVFDTTAWSRFPLPASHVPAGDGSEKAGKHGKSLWRQMLETLAAQQERHRKEREQLARELAELELQSTMTGAEPIAYISGRLVRPGDTINGFSVVRIQDKRVTLRKGGFTRKLTMP